MQTYKPELSAAIARFEAWPGVTAAQVDQLRSSLAADADVLASMNAEAASGALRDFAVGSAQGKPIPTGHYDPATGVVTLPDSVFSTADASASSDLTSVIAVQALVVKFSGQSYADSRRPGQPVSAEMVANLQDTLNGSPVLAGEIKRAATTSDPVSRQNKILKSFDIVPPGSGVGGSYDRNTHSMNLPADSLTNKRPGGLVGYDPYELSFVVGHEVQHGFNSVASEKGRSDFIRDAKSIASQRSPVHDYTSGIETYTQSRRDDEAGAEIAGWNALRSRVQQDVPNLTLTDMYRSARGRAEDFIEKSPGGDYVARPNVQLNADLSMSQAPANVAAMGHNYFDRPAPGYKAPSDTRQEMKLGTGYQSDYPNYDARWALATIAWAEDGASKGKGNPPQIAIDMARVGLHEDMIERAGLNIAPYRQVLPYIDTSQVPAAAHKFDQTADGKDAFKYVPNSPVAPPTPVESALHKELRNALPSETSPDRLAQIAFAAKEGGIEAGRIRTMDVVGGNLMLTGMTPGTRACVDLTSPPPSADLSNAQFHTLAIQQNAEQQVQAVQAQASPAMLHRH